MIILCTVFPHNPPTPITHSIYILQPNSESIVVRFLLTIDVSITDAVITFGYKTSLKRNKKDKAGIFEIYEMISRERSLISLLITRALVPSSFFYFTGQMKLYGLPPGKDFFQSIMRLCLHET